MTIKDWLAGAILQLDESPTAALDAKVLLAHFLDKDKAWLNAHDEYGLNHNEVVQLNQSVARRTNLEPVAYIIGHKEFYGRQFFVNSDVLIPRPESEAIVEYIEENTKKNATILDVGTGSGAIALSIKAQRPDLRVIGTDISLEALKVAKMNAELLKLKVDFVQSDLLKDIDQRFDVIAANLPYVPQSNTSKEISFEPQIALFGGIDGLDYIKKLLNQLPDHLNKDSYCLIEHEPDQFNSITKLTSLKLESLSKFVSKLS